MCHKEQRQKLSKGRMCTGSEVQKEGGAGFLPSKCRPAALSASAKDIPEYVAVVHIRVKGVTVVNCIKPNCKENHFRGEKR